MINKLTLYSTLSFLFLFSCTKKTSTVQHYEGESPKSCVERIIAADETLGDIRNHACEKISLSQTIKNYVAELKALDFNACPSDFTDGFDAHTSAWEDMVAVTDHYPNLRGEMHDLFDKIKEGEHAMEFNLRLKAIWDTWGSIESAIKKE